MKEWARVFETLAVEPGVTMMIGGPDTGKTTLTSFLANAFFEAGVTTAIVDADVGQSDIGPPGTIGLAIVDTPLRRMGEASLRSAYFVGANSPEGHMHYMIAGTRKMVDRAVACAARAILVDTTGLVHGHFGLHLKQAKYDAIEPRYVVGVQRSNEIEHILGPLERHGPAKVIRMGVSSRARARSYEERRQFRQAAYRRHFSPAIASRAPLDRLAFLRASRDVRLVPEKAFANALVGLLDSRGEFLAEGTIEQVDFRDSTVTIVSRLTNEEFSRVAAVAFGSLRVTPDGNEVGRIAPGEI
ncbi:MAG: Clp1/GlmU family protein [Ignavibacteriales bacterium]